MHIPPMQAVTDMQKLHALTFDNYRVEHHYHRHHVFQGSGRGADGFARGCPWACSFCNKTLFRNKYRERDVEAVLQEVDRLIARGVTYIYFIDEIFGVGAMSTGCWKELADRRIRSACRPASICGMKTASTCWAAHTASPWNAGNRIHHR